MGVLRFLLFLGIAVWVARLLWQRLRPPPPPPPVKQDGAAQALSRCSRCGTLIPHDLVVWHEERPYCGLACRDAGARSD